MGLVRYFVLQQGNDWLVTLEGRAMARCPSRTEATEAAIIMADLMGAMHHDSDVMVELGDGEPLELVWTYGQDKMPKSRRRLADKAGAHPHVRLVQRGDARGA